ncbi:MAG: hypothetical protein A2W99_08700 [Bacteroidetes bacterium GWF2_33_16]|nr:MAG: hypothetical protein A2W99_08700 [Bacteroidetes bacterium GWF2_33_16]
MSKQAYEKNIIFRFGFYTSILFLIITLITFAIAICTPPLSGPGCVANCFEYPYTDIISRFPRDYYWMYPAILLTLCYLVFMVCIHNYVSDQKKIFSQIGVLFSVISTLILVVDYFVQVSVIQPSLLLGETDGISLLTQYNPHGLFIALEDIGYIMMSFSFLFIAFAISKSSKLEKSLRWVFIISFILMVISFTGISIVHGIKREYRFEIAVITINWFALIISAFMMSKIFKRSIIN